MMGGGQGPMGPVMVLSTFDVNKLPGSWLG